MSQTPHNNDVKFAIWSIAIVVIALVAIIFIKISSNNSSNNAPAVATVAPAALIAKLSSLSAGAFEQVGIGTATKLPVPLKSAPALVKDGLPHIVYIGAEYCPFCAAERWPVVIALLRFGTFSGLGLAKSADKPEGFPNTATLSFHGATYTSKYLSFTGIEETTSERNASGGYTALDTPSADIQQLLTTYDAAPYVPASAAGSIPFIDFGGKYLSTGSSFDPGVLQDKTADQIAGAMADTSSSISKGAVGASNTITAALCTLTGNQPTSVCSSPMIQGLQAKLGN